MYNLLQTFVSKTYFFYEWLFSATKREFRTNNWLDWLTLIGFGLLFVVIVAFVIGVIAICILWPIMLLWAINLLFGTTVPLTFWTWLAVITIAWTWGRFTRVPIVKVTLDKKRFR